MEDDSNMSGLKTDEVGGNGENISASAVVEVFGKDDSNDITVRTLLLQKLRGDV